MKTNPSAPGVCRSNLRRIFRSGFWVGVGLWTSVLILPAPADAAFILVDQTTQCNVGATAPVDCCGMDATELAAEAADGCSIGEAICAANSNADFGGCTGAQVIDAYEEPELPPFTGVIVADTIILPLSTTFTLTKADNPVPIGDPGPNAFPPIDEPIVMDGNGSTLSGVTGAGPNRIPAFFRAFQDDSFLSLTDLTIEGFNPGCIVGTFAPGGCFSGGAILVGSFDLDAEGGSGLGDLEIHGSILQDNATLTPPDTGTESPGVGGAIAVGILSTVDINETIFARNTSIVGGAIAQLGFLGSLNISNSTFTENLAEFDPDADDELTGFGGAIAAPFTPVTIEQSAFFLNRAEQQGGALALVCSPATINDSSIFQNFAFGVVPGDDGGSGGIVGGLGGGLYTVYDLFDCIFFLSTFAAFPEFEPGNPLTDALLDLLVASELNLFNDTIARNFANREGGGIYTADGNGRVTLEETILGDNLVLSLPGFTFPVSGPDCEGTLLSNDHNLFGNTQGCTIPLAQPHDIFNVDPGLVDENPATPSPLKECFVDVPLAAGNQYCRPSCDSPALDAAGADVSSVDQIGAYRLLSDGVGDIGAIERPDCTDCGNEIVEKPFESCDHGSACSGDGQTTCNSDSDCFLAAPGGTCGFCSNSGAPCPTGACLGPSGTTCIQKCTGDQLTDCTTPTVIEDCQTDAGPGGTCDPKSGDGCSDECTLESCGNGVLDKDEECDDGQHCLADNSPCTSVSDCPLDDFGNATACVRRNNDGCNAACLREYCGDGVTNIDWGPDGVIGTIDDIPEHCDDGNTVDNDACGNDCQPPICGNGEIEANEECEFDDNGDPIDIPDSCFCHPTSCELECGGGGGLLCGNGTLDSGEQCDDGNADPFDDCTWPFCTLNLCGDGLHHRRHSVPSPLIDPNGQIQSVFPLERECDDGNLDGHDLCTQSCLSAVCGDSIIQGVAGEICDDGGTCAAGLNANNHCENLLDCPTIQETCDLTQTPPQCSGEAFGNKVCSSDEDCTSYSECVPQNDDGCNEFCQVEHCGDGTLDANGRDDIPNNADDEECDDNNNITGDGCTSTCKDEICGDGLVSFIEGEECDNGGECSVSSPVNPGADCNSHNDCSSFGFCDFNLANPVCVGGTNAGNTCTADSQCPSALGECEHNDTPDCTDCDDPLCGNGTLETGEECDEGAANSGAGDADCRPGCVLARCGDGIKDPLGADNTDDSGAGDDEQCDDGNQSDGDGCSDECKIELPPPFCGDGNTDFNDGEQCDDGNINPFDDCTNFCTFAHCGDNILHISTTNTDGANGVEDCDDGNHDDHDLCTSACESAVCGDGHVLSGGEDCDDGGFCSGSGSACNARLGSFCPVGETCDPKGGDGCSEFCEPEGCGDGVRDPDGIDPSNPADDEECDDGNQSNGDGCSDTCKQQYCGNSVIENGEECDTGGLCAGDGSACANNAACAGPGLDVCVPIDGDGCSRECLFEFCGDGRSNNGTLECNSDGCTLTGIEECDDGNFDTHDYCVECKSAVCGDGEILSGGEECDDGKTCVGDGVPPIDCDSDADCADIDIGPCKYECDGTGALGVDCEFDNESICDGFDNGGDCVPVGCTGDLDQGCNTDDDCQFPSATGTCVQQSGDGCSNICEEEFCGDDRLDLNGPNNTDEEDGALDDDDEECDDGAQSSGDGCDDHCKLESCGDGITQPSEECDDGDLDDNDGCSHLCREERCGDGFLQTNEECDDGAQSNGDGCDDQCNLESCGDGIVQFPAEECDDGLTDTPPLVDGDGCSHLCREERCGDGIQQPDEQCDDGNQSSEDGCSDICDREFCGDGIVMPSIGEECEDTTPLPDPSFECINCEIVDTNACGDGQHDPGEECDDGDANNDDDCTNACTLPRCGDGIEQSSEECDDGNINPNDACTTSCRNNDCGDGFIEFGVEECDDGNTNNGDGCNEVCEVEDNCPNGVVQVELGEECDDGNDINEDFCSNACQRPFCGDGVTAGAEDCDDGNKNPNDDCKNDCTDNICGDGIVQLPEIDCSECGFEECDDGNGIDNDGCSDECIEADCGDGVVQVQAGEECDPDEDGAEPLPAGCFCSEHCEVECADIPQPYCGDNVTNAAEECDDGNNVNGDACTNNCTNAVCGDGITGPGEECDDGDADMDDGCLNDCTTAACGDGVVFTGVEQCDDGNTADGDGCDSDCFNEDGPTPTDPTDPAGALCGNGQVEGDEECDAGEIGEIVNSDAPNAPSGCRTDCTKRRCGDTVVDNSFGEECDGSLGCTSSCKNDLCFAIKEDAKRVGTEGFSLTDYLNKYKIDPFSGLSPNPDVNKCQPLAAVGGGSNDNDFTVPEAEALSAGCSLHRR